MVWGFFSSAGVGNICIIDGKMNSEAYCRILDTHLAPSAKKLN